MPFNAFRCWAACVLLVVNLACASAVRGQGARAFLEKAWIEPQVGERLPVSAEFRDHQGRAVQLAELLGERPTVLCLVYFECPMLCRLAADGLVRTAASISQQVGTDYNVALISFDPRDTPERAQTARSEALRRYGKQSDGRGWYFLTGEQKAIDQLTQAVGFHYAWDPSIQQFSHASGVALVAPDGTITEYLNGVHFVPRDLSAAIERAAATQLATAQETSFVRCYLYDPTTGRLGAAVQWSLRGLGAATVLLLCGMVVRLSSNPTTAQRQP